jgi:multiple sugar transport system ATP-binding protein
MIQLRQESAFMAYIEFKNVGKTYPNKFVAVKGFNLEINKNEFIVLVGPSGCGKTTTLRMVAGLEEITTGTISINGQVVNDLEPKDRNIAMVFQNYALYPHMTVLDNMTYGLKYHHIDKEEIKRRVAEASKILGFDDYLLKRKPAELSGGQRQRVALGRAIIRHPAVFLMDEPLSNLDAKLRVQMRTEISKIHDEVGATTIYVTHDQTEAMTMASRIVVMDKGVIQQIDTPEHMYDYPYNLFVAGFIGAPAMNMIHCVYHKDGVLSLDDGRKLTIEEKDRKYYEKYDNKKVILGVRPENCHLTKEGHEHLSDDFALDGKVRLIELLGAESYEYIDCTGISITTRTIHKNPINKGDATKVYFNQVLYALFDEETGLRIPREE